MKLIVVFEVPDNRAEAYADVVARMVRHHQFSEGIGVNHWSFDLQMRPTGALLVPDSDAITSDQVAAADMMAALLEDPLSEARREQDHSEAVREDWARRTVAAAGKSWETHLAKFDGTVLPR